MMTEADGAGRTGGEGVTNFIFLCALANGCRDGNLLWTSHFIGDPGGAKGEWHGQAYGTKHHEEKIADTWGQFNAYYSVAALKPDPDGVYARKIVNFDGLLTLVADDADPAGLLGTPTYILTTSPGKRQVGVLIDPVDPDRHNLGLVSLVVKRMSDLGLLGSDRSGNNIVRYVRLPVGTNHKPRESGPFKHVLERWNPGQVMGLADAAGMFGVEIDELRPQADAETARLLGSGMVIENGGQPRGERLQSDTSGDHESKIRSLVYDLISSNSLHDPVMRLAASWISTGMSAGAAVTSLRALMDSSSGERDKRWHDRYRDIPRAVSQAVAKYGGRTAQHQARAGGPGAGAGGHQDKGEQEFESLNPRGAVASGASPGQASIPAAPGELPGAGPGWVAPSVAPGGTLASGAYSTPEEKPLFAIGGDLSKEIGPVDYLIKGWIERNTLSMVYGPPAGGKSFLLMDWCLSVARGEPWQFNQVKQGATFILAGEGFHGIRRRLAAYAKHHNIDLGNVPIFLSQKAMMMLDEDEAQKVADEIYATCVKYNVTCELVAVDTVNRNFGDGDENDQGDVTRFLMNIDRFIKQRFKCAVVIVHHTGHNQDRARGSSVFRASVDSEYYVRPNGQGELIVECKKMKDGDTPTAMMLTIQKVTILAATKDAEEITGAVLIRTGDPLGVNILTPSTYRGQAIPAMSARDFMRLVIEQSDLPMAKWSEQSNQSHDRLRQAKKAAEAAGWIKLELDEKNNPTKAVATAIGKKLYHQTGESLDPSNAEKKVEQIIDQEDQGK